MGFLKRAAVVPEAPAQEAMGEANTQVRGLPGPATTDVAFFTGKMDGPANSVTDGVFYNKKGQAYENPEPEKCGPPFCCCMIYKTLYDKNGNVVDREGYRMKDDDGNDVDHDGEVTKIKGGTEICLKGPLQTVTPDPEFEKENGWKGKNFYRLERLSLTQDDDEDACTVKGLQYYKYVIKYDKIIELTEEDPMKYRSGNGGDICLGTIIDFATLGAALLIPCCDKAIDAIPFPCLPRVMVDDIGDANGNPVDLKGFRLYDDLGFSIDHWGRRQEIPQETSGDSGSV
jgi:hypothetical protein